MVQIYIKYTDNNFYLLDLDNSEGINLKQTFKDLGDISKIYSPFTQAFSLAATDKNRMLCRFIGNEKILGGVREFESMIYVGGFIFQSGILSVNEIEYEFNNQTKLKASFASNLTSLNDKLGELTIQDIFPQDSDTIVEWNNLSIKDRMSSVKNLTLSNGIEFKYGIPFISNNRVWTYNPNDFNITDNIAYKKTRAETSVNQISIKEVRPAVNYMSIMQHLILKIGTPVICPLFDKPELKDLFVWCNSENLISTDTPNFQVKNYNSPLDAIRYNYKRDNNAVTPPSIENVKWLVTADLPNGVLKIKRNNATSGEQGAWSDGFNVIFNFANLQSLGGGDIKIKVNLINNTTGVVIDSKEVGTEDYNFRVLDPRSESPTMLDSNGELYLRIEILPLTLVSWTSMSFRIFQAFNYTRRVGLANRTGRADYLHIANNFTASSLLGGNNLNLINALPKIKCTDFLKSFFKMFNIAVVPTGKNDQSMYWLTPSDIQEVNKPYSKRIVDYTNFADISTLTKKKASEYNQYVFSHSSSKYYDALYGDGSLFGSLTYPAIAPNKPTKFEVKTDYSILKQRQFFGNIRTAYGFTKDAPEVLDNGGNRYKEVFEEFTIFYLNQKTLGSDPLSIELSLTQNNALYSVLEPSNDNGKSLTFGDFDSLYLNYYKTFIEMLLRDNIYQSEFNVNLPANEVFLNFANLTQGESNIPTGFRVQNEIVIGEQRYFLIDSAIDLTDGKAKLTLLNF